MHSTDSSTPQPTGLLPGDRLDEVETTIYTLHHICALYGDFAGQHGNRVFTDGLQLEHFSVVFGWLSDQLHHAHLHVCEIQKEFIGDAT